MTLKTILQRVSFVLLSAAAMVFFSEKTFWYIQGYAILELVLFYAVPISVCLAVLSYFRVQHLSGVVLVGSLFGFLVEGTLTPVLYEGGLLDPILPAYFVGWHGLLSMVFGWYLIHQWLREGRWKRLLTASSLFGAFWGIWSLAYRLPESVQEFQGYLQAGETWFPGAWPAADFAIYCLVFVLMLLGAHWLLGRGLWQPVFRFAVWEIGILTGILALLYFTQVFPAVPIGFLKLAGLISLVVIPLRLQQGSAQKSSLLEELSGPVRFSHALVLLCMALTASLVYSLAEIFPPPEDLIRTSRMILYLSQTLIGGGAFLWAWVDSIIRWSRRSAGG